MLKLLGLATVIGAALLIRREERIRPSQAGAYTPSGKKRVADWDEMIQKNMIRPVIVDFVKYLNSSLPTDESPMIVYWDFIGSSVSEIEFRMLGEDHAATYQGTLTFTSDQNCPRVEKLEYVNRYGRFITVKGIQLQTFSVEQVLKSLRTDKQDKGKLSYLGQKASEAIRSGESIFSIVEYEKMKPEDFDAVCGETEIMAYCRLLEEENFETEHMQGPYIRLTPSEDPVQ